MNFLVIDFESASSVRYNPCDLGMTQVVHGKLDTTLSWLIKPPCHPFFERGTIWVHNITPDDVAHSPTFDVLWREIKDYFQDTLVAAHNATYDRDVLEKTLEYYHLPKPNCDWLCSQKLAKKLYPGEKSYGLKRLCAKWGIRNQRTHSGGGDSEATAKIMLKMMDEKEITDLRPFIEPPKR